MEAQHAFTGWGVFTASNSESGTFLLSSDFAYEVLWDVLDDGSLARGRISLPAMRPTEIAWVAPPRSCLGVRVRAASVRSLLGPEVLGLTSGEEVLLQDLSSIGRQFGSIGHLSELKHGAVRLATTSAASPFVREVQDLLSRRPQRVTLAEQLSGIGYSYRQTTRRFKAHTGVPLEHFARLERLQRAKAAYLRKPSCLGRIAIACGYADDAHLSHESKRLTGRSFHRFVLGYELPD